MTLLTVEGLQGFYGASQVLHGIDLQISPGEQIALLGRNGMGKTSFLRSLVGALPKVAGEVALNGKSIRGRLPEHIAQAGVAIVPEGRGVFGSLSVIENLVMAARPGPTGKRQWTLDRVLSVFPRLAQRRGHGGHQLSGGEQQMLTIGRALMTNPDLLLIDEATEGLAPLVAQEIWKTLGIIRSEGIATVVVDKDVKNLSRVADRMIIMSKGKLVFAGTPAELAGQGDLLERHLGVQ
ncbi:ABC transporter [Agrobacterium tumefaciens]|uniref:ABC transporter n=1 Tax=Agrobacterium tumefaciens TaxID=358 RepID=A0A0D0KQN2_AGRTU|nr:MULTISPECIES: ABC transporter ATP-binding protein [unclassified Rhizobium]KIQ00350.1 ABC transporter [Agrobacterium tumefaciens]MBD8687713.1 ABC transporter ATP-binding protein [Rhizobium sp. CFBP 13644]MBD8692167.1 ABC transporter ATP-binding protein [Rhizobium sp. CFBP 13717]